MNLCVRAVFVLLKVSDCSRFASKREEMCVCGGRAHLHRVVLHEVCGRLIFRFARIDTTETETDGDGIIHFLHKYVVDMSHFFAQARFIDGADLLQQDDGILHEPEALCIDVNMGGKLGFSQLACDGGCDDGGAIFVANVILDDEHGAQTPLLTADDGAEIGIIDISAFDGHFDHSFFL